MPAERFHGQSEQVLLNLSQGVDIKKHAPYPELGIERSLFNLVVGSKGDLTLHLMGRPIHLTGRTS